MRPKKCELRSKTISFLGHKVGDGKEVPLQRTLEKIQQAQRPQTKRQVRSFLGLSGYYRGFIPNYAGTAAPLTELTRNGKTNRILWSHEAGRAFNELKKALSNPPILRLADLQKPFVIRTDASDPSIAAILLQEEYGTLHPVSYASRQLRRPEQAYATVEKEGLALVWGINKFRPHFVVKTM